MRLFTGLRLTDGINLGDIRDRYGVDVWERYGAELATHVEAGLLRREGPASGSRARVCCWPTKL